MASLVRKSNHQKIILLTAMWKIMRKFGIGITNKDFDKISASKTLAKKYSGKIFIKV